MTWSSHPTRVRAVRLALAACGALLLTLPGTARAQSRPPAQNNEAPEEQFRIEVGASFWNPSVLGTVSSDISSVVGSQLDFAKDLGFPQTQFRVLSAVLKPGRKHRIRFEYVPITYSADATLSRNVVFQGQTYAVSLPIHSDFNWKVWRLGYEYDVVAGTHGYAGFFVEARVTDSLARVTSALASGEVARQLPLPAVGFAGRGYVAKGVSLTAEIGGFKIPKILNKYQGNYLDVSLYGTVDIGRYVGAQIGWRRMHTLIDIQDTYHYTGDFTFQAIWWGGVVRY